MDINKSKKINMQNLMSYYLNKTQKQNQLTKHTSFDNSKLRNNQKQMDISDCDFQYDINNPKQNR